MYGHMKLIDTHCHINHEEHFPDPSKAIEAALAAGIETLIAVALDEADAARAIKLAEAHPCVFAVVGVHPSYSAGYAGSDWIREMLTHPKVVALGEIGLDYHWDHATREQQDRALNEQLDLAEELKVPVVFHCREAYPDLLERLESRPKMPYLFHCFAGNWEEAQRVLALGGIFGFDGPITYKKNSDLRDLVAKLPHNSLVLETDSPYMTPEPHRGKPNSPALLPLINKAVADSLGISELECAALTTKNAKRFFRLD